MRIPRPRGAGWATLLATFLLLSLAPARAAGARRGPGPYPQVRLVSVTDAHCGVDGARESDHRRCALECSSKGHPLVLWDARSEALYTVLYPSEDLHIKVINDFAGLQAFARGIWDDEEQVVRLLDMTPPGEEEVSLDEGPPVELEGRRP